MRERKRCFECYSYYDHAGIAAHLEKMAGKGWRLQKMTWGGWIYERIEPQRLKFTVSYYAKASALDPKPSEEQWIFYDFCAHTGWKLVCTFGQLQVFCSEEENPVPIETDPVLEVENIHKATKKGLLLGYLIILIDAIYQGHRVFPLLWREPVLVLSNVNMIYAFILLLFLLLDCGIGTGRYFYWYFRAKRAAKQGRFLKVKGHFLQKTARHMWCFAVIFITVCWFIAFWSTGTKLEHWICCSTMACTSILVVLGLLEAAYLKRIDIPGNMNMAVTIFSVLLIGLVLTGVIRFVTLRGMNFGAFEQEVWRHGETCIMHQKEPPLSAGDLSDMECDHFVFQWASESPLLGQRVARFYSKEGLTELHYTLTVIKVPFLYDWCKEQLMQEAEKSENTAGTEHHEGKRYIQEDASPWGAQEAYWLSGQEPGAYHYYLLLFEDRMVQIGLRREPTSAQKAIVGEKLAGDMKENR